MLFRKKGFLSTIQIAIIALVSLIVMSLFLYKAYVGIRNNTSVQSCKDSIATHSFVAGMSERDIFTDIKCPTNEITIKNLKDTNPTIAEDMHTCWYEWGKGKGQYFQGDGVFCHICSIYSFNNKGQTVNGLTQYLTQTPIQLKYTGDTQGITYMDYFQGYSTPKSAEMVQENIQKTTTTDTLDTSQEYASIFVYASGKDVVSKTLDGNRAALAASGGIFVAAGTTAGIAAAGGFMTTLSAAAVVGTLNSWNPVGWVILGSVGVVSIGVGAAATYEAAFGGKDPEWISYIALRQYNADQLKLLGCEKLDVN